MLQIKYGLIPDFSQFVVNMERYLHKVPEEFKVWFYKGLYRFNCMNGKTKTGRYTHAI